ncbi:MAG TPA: VWA domain-containing protein [Gaiellaceae bacterium]|jgi:Ca-activated chloride channel family protein|nr:VWA domain-containing protein [Gaiellaceae bacterium]
MSFEAPWALLTLVVPIVGLAVYWWWQRRPDRYAVHYPNLPVLAVAAGRSITWRRHVPAVLLALAVATLAFAFARPTMPFAAVKEGATVILVVDVSGSMRAEDVQPTRIEAAKQAMRRFVEDSPKSLRIGIVSFTDDAQVVVPPTTDHDLLQAGVDTLAPGFGTALGDGIGRAVEVAQIPVEGGQPLPPPDQDSKPVAAIVVLSDGAQTRGILSPDDAAGRASAARMAVYTVALGTDDGEIEVYRYGQRQRIPVPPDRETLARIAEATGGEAFDAPDAGRLNDIYGKLGSTVGREDEQREVTVAFVAAGAALLLAAGAFAGAWMPRLP